MNPEWIKRIRKHQFSKKSVTVKNNFCEKDHKCKKTWSLLNAHTNVAKEVYKTISRRKKQTTEEDKAEEENFPYQKMGVHHMMFIFVSFTKIILLDLFSIVLDNNEPFRYLLNKKTN